jgi:hypothetical protein
LDIPVVVAMTDGTRLKGMIGCFNPDHPTLSLQLIDGEDAPADVLRLETRKIDAVFFIRELANDRFVRLTDYHIDDESSSKPSAGELSLILLRSGERLEGVVEFSAEDRKGLFLIPSGPAARAGNTVGVWISTRAVVEARPLSEGDAQGDESPSSAAEDEIIQGDARQETDSWSSIRAVRFRRRRFS